MANTHIYNRTCQSLHPSHTVYLDQTHIVEVRKQGQQIGIYTITKSGKKRGILLPLTTWQSLNKLTNLINVTIDLAVGSIDFNQIEQTFSGKNSNNLDIDNVSTSSEGTQQVQGQFGQEQQLFTDIVFYPEQQPSSAATTTTTTTETANTARTCQTLPLLTQTQYGLSWSGGGGAGVLFRPT